MRKFGCLLIGLICFVSIVGVYAFNIIEKDDVHTPDYYESNVRSMFGREQWEAGKQLLDEGLSIYPDVNGLNELCGRYHYRKKDYDTARYFLVRAVRDNPENVEAKQLLIKVEDETRNYSSAICYVNELLEINPLLARTLAEEDRALSETGQCRRSRPPAQEAEANLS